MSNNRRAINAPRRDVFLLPPDDLVVIGIDTEAKNKNDHYLYDERIKLPADEGMVLNILEYGVLEPIMVTKDGDQVLVVDGRQRVLHAREAVARQKKTGVEEEKHVRVPVMFKRGEESTLFGMSRSANALRRNDSIISNATNAQRMLDMGAEIGTVATTFGVKVSTLQNSWLPLLGLSPKVRAAVAKGEVSPQAALGLTSLPKAEQDEHLDKLREEGVRPTATAVGNRVRAAKGKDAAKTPSMRNAEAYTMLTGLYASYAEGNLIEGRHLEKLGKLLTGKSLESERKAALKAEIAATKDEGN